MAPRTRKPAPLLPVLTVEDRCAECGWTLYVSLSGSIYCVKPRCSKQGVDLAEEAS